MLERLRKKAALYAQDFAPDGTVLQANGKLDVDGVVDFYESFIIPLTKEVEVSAKTSMSPHVLTPRKVDYLLQRLDGLTPAQIEELANRKKT